MALRIESVKTISVSSSSATDEDVNYRAFIIANNSADKTVYFKEKSIDDADVTADNGFSLPANTVLDKTLRAKTLSIKASGSAVVKILYVTEED